MFSGWSGESTAPGVTQLRDQCLHIGGRTSHQGHVRTGMGERSGNPRVNPLTSQPGSPIGVVTRTTGPSCSRSSR